MGHQPSPLHLRRLKSQHHENHRHPSTTPHSLWATPPTPLPDSLIMFLGTIVLVSRGFSVHLPPLSAFVSRTRLAFARSATPSRPCYRRLGLQFAVEENSSTGCGGFLHSLHFRYRLPSQTRTRLTIVSTVLGSTPPSPPPGFVPLLGYSYNPLLFGWHPYYPRRPSRFTLRSHPSVTLCRRIALPRWPMSTPLVLM